MKLKFKNQQYQDEAVMSVINCFNGQKKENKRESTTFIKTVDEGTLLERTEELEVF